MRVEFRGTQLSSDGGLLVMRELDDALGLSDLAATAPRDTRRDKNTVHQLDEWFWQLVFRWLAGYEDVKDADRLAIDPVMRQFVGGRAVDAKAASALQMGRFETETLALAENRDALVQVHHHRPNGPHRPRRQPPIASAAVMRVTAIHAQTNENGRTGPPAPTKNTASDPEQSRLAVCSAQFQQPGRPQAPLWTRSLVQQSDLGYFHVPRLLAWGNVGSSYR